MFYFDRICRLVIESKSRLEIENCRIKFEIIKSAKPKENTAKVEIYNLAPDTRNSIGETESSIRILAGYAYAGGLIEIGQGDITKIKHNRDKTEVVTEIYMAEGIFKIRTKPISFGFPSDSKATLGTILKEISNQSGMGFKVIDADTTRTITMGYSDVGSLDLILDNLAINFGFTWSIQNGVISIKGTKASNKKEILLLTPESGLILHPESVKKVSKRLEKSEIIKLAKKSRLAQCLLQPKMQIHDIVRIESQDLNGLFEVHKISHIGDTRGNDWYSNIEIIAFTE